jgi:glycerol-3-phosphate acyltransferase PlsY
VNFVAYGVVAVVAYFLGSIPTGYLVGKAKGIDLRTAGSGNIGATNALRILGKPAGIFVLLVDAAKGFVACYLGVFVSIYFTNRLSGLHSTADFDSNSFVEAFNSIAYFPIIAGIFAVLGHSFTCWLRFKGGKGVATSAGVYFALAPLAVGIALATWIVVFAVSRYVSLASIAAAIALPAAVWLMPNSLALRLVTTALGLLVIWKHKGNIERLLSGRESRVGGKQPAQEGAK